MNENEEDRLEAVRDATINADQRVQVFREAFYDATRENDRLKDEIAKLRAERDMWHNEAGNHAEACAKLRAERDKLSYLLVECSVPLEQYEYAEQLLRRAKDVIGAVAETGNPDWELLQEVNSLLEDGEPVQAT